MMLIVPALAMFWKVAAPEWLAAVFPTPAVLWVFVVLFAALAIGTVYRLLFHHQDATATHRQRLASLRTWWILFGLFAASIMTGRPGVCLLFGTASLLALREYFALPNMRATCTLATAVVAYLWTAGNYVLLVIDLPDAFRSLSPLVGLILGVIASLTSAGPTDHVRRVASHYWGMMVLGYGPAHLPLLLTIQGVHSGAAVYLVVLTQCGDIVQALVGRRFSDGRGHAITPHISPRKTWEGFLGGLLAVLGLSIALGPVLLPSDTPFGFPPLVWHSVIGTVVFLSAFLGGSNTSAVKRDAGVKDSSSLLPGMGGVIDRLDSFTLAAPALFYLLCLTVTK
ncbi:MAG: Phosphatidate cytidylyltransferase [Planctomycetota bacterium]